MASLATGASKNPHRRSKSEIKRTTEHGRCVPRDIMYSREEFTNNGKPMGVTRHKRIRVMDCFLKQTEPPNANSDKKAAMALFKRKLKGSRDIGYDNLPIYVINAHSSDEFFVELKPPEGMNNNRAREEQEYSYADQIGEGFVLKGVNDARRRNYPTSSNFFKTPANSGVFIIQASPTGFDAIGCPQEKPFRQSIAMAPVETREKLLSPDFKTFFSRPENSSASSIYIPPGYSVINKGYQFWEHSSRSQEAWGILCLTDGSVPHELLGRQRIYYTSLDNKYDAEDRANSLYLKERVKSRPIKPPYSETPITVTDFGDHYVTNFPQLHPRNVGFSSSSENSTPAKHKKVRKLIEDSIKNRSDVSLKAIVETLGPGIYIDMGCASMSLKIWNPIANNGKGKFDNYGPDLVKRKISSGDHRTIDIDGIQPIYNVVHEDLEIYAHKMSLAWNNITTDLTTLIYGENGANKRLEELEDHPDLKKVMNASRVYAREGYNNSGTQAGKRAERNHDAYMQLATQYLDRNEFNQLKLPSVNELGTIAPQTIAERMKMRKSRKKNKGGRRKKTRKKKGGNVSGINFIVKNDEDSIQAFFNSVRNRQNQGMFKNHGWTDEEGLEKLESQMMESLLNEEYTDGIYGVTYDANRDEGIYGHFFADYFDDENSLIERLPTVSNQNRFPDNLNQLESAVEEPLPFGLRSPNTIMNINNLQGGRRKKTRRKKSKKNKRKKTRTKKK